MASRVAGAVLLFAICFHMKGPAVPFLIFAAIGGALLKGKPCH